MEYKYHKISNMKFIFSLMLMLLVISGRSQVDSNTVEVIKQIRTEYAKINSIKLDCKRQDLNDMSTEGGEIQKCYDEHGLRKAVLIFYGETGKSEVEYYFKNNNIIFSYAKEDKYNAPIYMKEGGKILSSSVSRFYFDDEKLIRWLDNDNKIVKVDLYPAKEEEIKKDLKAYKIE
jgi:hypothetical protein